MVKYWSWPRFSHVGRVILKVSSTRSGNWPDVSWINRRKSYRDIAVPVKQVAEFTEAVYRMRNKSYTVRGRDEGAASIALFDNYHVLITHWGILAVYTYLLRNSFAELFNEIKNKMNGIQIICSRYISMLDIISQARLRCIYSGKCVSRFEMHTAGIYIHVHSFINRAFCHKWIPE